MVDAVSNEDDESTVPASTQRIDKDRIEQPDLMDGDDEILDAIWDRRGREEAAKRARKQSRESDS